MVPFYSVSDYVYKDCKQEQETTGNGEADGRLKQEHVLKSELDLRLDIKTPGKRNGTYTEVEDFLEDVRATCKVFQAIIKQITAKTAVTSCKA